MQTTSATSPSTSASGNEAASPVPAQDRRHPRAWLMWAVALTAYLVAVFHRTSLGVSGLDAADRFHASASDLSFFAVLQLLVYAGLQVPVGVLLDRWGSRRLVLIGAALMTAGQVVLALATDVPTAVLARVLVGAGDAMTFISVLRLLPAWFPARQVPVLTQATGIIGQLGQIASAFPLVALLHGPGWTVGFGAAAGVGVLVTILVLAVLRDAPVGTPRQASAPSLAEVRRQVVRAWQHPGTRLGLWSHFTSQFSGTVFALLWGFPFLVSGQGLPPATASTLMGVLVFSGMVVGPFFGRFVSRHPLRRSWLVLASVGVPMLAWTVVLLQPGPAPMWLLVVLLLALSLGGPGSMIAFDFARTFNPPARLGSATGIVNVGGFVASLLTMLLVGIGLDLLTPAGAAGYSLDAFRGAFAVQFLIWGVGTVGILRTRRLVRRRLAQDGVVVPPIREAIARERARRRELRAA